MSLKVTHICVVDGEGTVLARGREATQPELLAKAIKALAPAARVVVLETGGQSSWLQRELSARGIPGPRGVPGHMFRGAPRNPPGGGELPIEPGARVVGAQGLGGAAGQEGRRQEGADRQHRPIRPRRQP